MSVIFNAAKPYFDFEDDRLTLENIPVPSEARPSAKVSGPLIALEHSLLMNSVMTSLFPEW